MEATYTVHIEPAEEGGFIAYFPALPGCQTQGETLDEVIAMARDALSGYLECLRAHGDPIPVEKPRVEAGWNRVANERLTRRMTRLPTLNSRKVIQALERAGFVFFKQSGSHCILRHPMKRLSTSVPIHGKDVKRSLMKEILQQAELSEEEFRALL